MALNATFDQPELSLAGKLKSLPLLFILMVIALGLVGGGALYSAANGSFMPWAKPHLIRFAMSIVIMLAFALVDIRIWFRLAYPAYAIMLALLAGVRWRARSAPSGRSAGSIWASCRSSRRADEDRVGDGAGALFPWAS